MSDFLTIQGGARLQGEVVAAGAKNAALPLLITTLLTAEKCKFTNVPDLQDVSITLKLLEHFGALVERGKNSVTISVPVLRATEASYSLVKGLTSIFLGACSFAGKGACCTSCTSWR